MNHSPLSIQLSPMFLSLAPLAVLCCGMLAKSGQTLDSYLLYMEPCLPAPTAAPPPQPPPSLQQESHQYTPLVLPQPPHRQVLPPRLQVPAPWQEIHALLMMSMHLLTVTSVFAIMLYGLSLVLHVTYVSS